MYPLAEGFHSAVWHCKEWEREARTEGMSAGDLRPRKAGMVEQLNALLAVMKGMAQADARKSELLAGATSTSNSDQHSRNQVRVAHPLRLCR
jgi:hypothetical protein